MINSYTREAGVRQLERELGAICRGVATRIAEGRKEPITIERGRGQRLSRPAKVFQRGRATNQPAGRRHRTGVDPGRRRYIVCRSDQDARQR